MKQLGILAFLAFFAGAIFAQDTTKQQPPPSVQTDTTSGWQLVYSNPHQTFAYIKFFQLPERTVGYAVCASGSGRFLLLTTTDLGNTWDSLPTLIPALPITFLNSQLGFCTSGNVDSVWKTTDGGQSWNSSYRNTSHNGILAFKDKSDSGLVVGNEVARTTDNGKTWSKINISYIGASNFLDASFGDSKTCYAVSELSPFFPQQHATDPWTGGCMKTTNAGLTWVQLKTSIYGDLSSCYAFDANTVVVASTSGIVGKTMNGGMTWDTMNIPHAGFNAASFTHNGHGFLVGGDNSSIFFGIIFSTPDSGKTWTSQFTPNLTVLYGVCCLNDSIAFAYGDSGRIYRTTTGGNFSSVAIQHIIDFHVQVFPNPTTGNVTIQYQLPLAQQVGFTFYNVQGVLVGSLNSGMQNSGSHEVVYDGSALANGVYYFRLTTPQDSFTGSFTIQK